MIITTSASASGGPPFTTIASRRSLEGTLTTVKVAHGKYKIQAIMFPVGNFFGVSRWQLCKDFPYYLINCRFGL